MNLLKQAIEIFHRSKQRIDAAIIRHIVTKIGHGRWVDRGDPDGIDAELGQGVKALKNPPQNAVTVSVLERARINLIDDAVLPPGQLRHLNKCSFCPSFKLKDSPYDQRSLVQERRHLLALSCYLLGCKR